ncbi:unnamed protein product [Peniophora sp. CBMAI 1063]|nr:unnamed protein product [Peniophora sp. CBMAI 1063]
MSSISSTSKDVSFINPSDMDTSSSAPSSPKVLAQPLMGTSVAEEHPLYYFHDGSFAFELEGTKYRVHSSLLARHCGFTSTWAEDLSDPTSARITRADIDAFLSMIYLATYEYVDLNLSVESWTSILRLATMWIARPIRALAIEILGPKVSAIDKLLLCREYDVDEWLSPACAAIALRPAPLTMAEADQLEKSDIVRIFSAREAVSKGGVDATEQAISAWIAGLSRELVPTAAPPSVETTLIPSSQPIAEASAPIEPAAVTDTPPVQLVSEGLSENEELTGSSAMASASQNDAKYLDGALIPPSPEEALRQHLASNTSSSLFQSSTTKSTPSSISQKAGTSSLDTSYVLPVQEVAPPSVPVRAPEEKLTHAVDAIHNQLYDDALNSLTMDNLKSVARQVAPSLILHNPERPGVGNIKRLRALLRAVLRRVVTNPGFIPCGAQFTLALSIQPPLRSIRFEDALQVDMQSLASNWATFKAGGKPGNDVGNIMADLSTSSKKVYETQMGHGKGFFRTLVRLAVLPGPTLLLYNVIAVIAAYIT